MRPFVYISRTEIWTLDKARFIFLFYFADMVEWKVIISNNWENTVTVLF